MKKLYIDIDGVLLTNKNTQRPQYAVEFIDYITNMKLPDPREVELVKGGSAQ